MATTTFQLLGSTVRLVHVVPAAFSLLDWRTPPDAPAPPLHLHRQTDEGIYVASGRLATDIDGEQTTHEQGSFALIRRGREHTFWNPGENTASYLVLITPPGLESYFSELAAGLAAGLSPDDANALRRDLVARYDVEIAGERPASPCHAVPRGENRSRSSEFCVAVGISLSSTTNAARLGDAHGR
jgi:mannose-6-phosphate isomerase-like protein (cupin superfamily)